MAMTPWRKGFKDTLPRIRAIRAIRAIRGICGLMAQGLQPSTLAWEIISFSR